MSFARAELVGVTDHRQGQCRRGALREIAGERPPLRADIDVAARHRGDDVAISIAVDSVADEIVGETGLRQRMRRRCVHRVLADRRNADLQLAQPLVFERCDVEPAVGARDQDVAGPVIGAGGFKAAELDRHANDKIASPLVERRAD